MASELKTYGDAARVQDVLPLVEILTAKETWFLQNLPKSSAKDTIHGVMTDTLRAAASQAVKEADDYTNLVLTTPTRRDNIVEIIAVPIKVGHTTQQVQHYHGVNEKARQTAKAMADWGNAAEYDIVRSTLASGVSGTAPKMSFGWSGLTSYGKGFMLRLYENIMQAMSKNLLGQTFASCAG